MIHICILISIFDHHLIILSYIVLWSDKYLALRKMEFKKIEYHDASQINRNRLILFMFSIALNCLSSQFFSSTKNIF